MISAKAKEIFLSGQFSSFTSGSDDPTHVQTVDTVDTLTTFVVNDTTSKQLNTIAADKTQFTTIGRDINKSQSILLQRRGNNFELNESAYRATFDDSEDSDDEVEIVDIIKDDKGEQSRTKNERKIENEVETVLSKQAQIQNKVIEALPNSSKIVINNKFVNVINTASSGGLTKSANRMATNNDPTIRINPKYLKLLSNKSGSNCAPNNSTSQDIERNKLDAPRSTIRLNAQYTSTIGGSNPKDCGNIVNSECSLQKRTSETQLLTRSTDKLSANTEDLGEPLPNLWKFLRALLHNPTFNPKLIAWKEMERGEFRMNSLQEFYRVWEDMKKSDINYELWVKTLRVYDDKKYLHSVQGFRCCYKFGIMASNWKPFPHEILITSKTKKMHKLVLMNLSILILAFDFA